MKPLIIRFVFLLMALPLLAGAQDKDTLSGLFDHWYTDGGAALNMTIKTDLRALMRKSEESAYQDAVLTCTLPDGSVETFEVGIRVRGNVRKEICALPPLKVKFSKKDLAKTGFSDFNKFKIVVPCQENEKGSQYLYREYHAYRMYNRLSPYSFRVQMVHLHLIDSENKKPDEIVDAILIEPEESLAARNGGRIIERKNCRTAFLEREPYLKMAFFQYMIGNTDWYVYNLHNLILMGIPDSPKLIPVPYDFDYAGLVNAHYAVPHSSLPIRAVTQRLYLGLSCTDEEADALIQTFTQAQDTLLNPIRECNYLEKRDRDQMIDFLEDFFKQLAKVDRMKKVLEER